MLTKILSKIGLPILVKFVSSSLSNINSDVAKTAVSALVDVNDAISKEQISLEQIKEANRHLEQLYNLEADLDEKTLSLIHETIRQELRSEDKFVRFWRPAFGYAVSIAWMMVMITICYVILSNRPDATEIIMALVETTSLWSVALGVLGVSVVKRSQEKLKIKNEDILSKVVNKVI